MKVNLLSTGTLAQCIALFSRSERRKITFVVLIQVVLGFLDLLGVAIIGVVGALAVTGIQSREPGSRIAQILTSLNLESSSLQVQTATLTTLAAFFLVSRTILSIFVSRRVLLFISNRSAAISSDLISHILNQDLNKINSRSIHETIYMSTAGVTAATTGVIGTIVTVIADASILVVMSIGLFALDPVAACASGLLYSGIGYVLYRTMHLKASNYGNQEASLNVNSNSKIAEVLISYRENLVRNRRSYYAQRIGKVRFDLSRVIAELSFLPLISKYIIEISLVIGAVSIAALQFQLDDSRKAIATLAVFLAAGSRIAPAVLRIQQSLIAIKANLGAAEKTLLMIKSLPKSTIDLEISAFDDVHLGFEPTIKISNVTYFYPNSVEPVVQNVELKIDSNTRVAIVGPSGSGKSTLVDLMLGMYKPASGEIKISNLSPETAVRQFPGAIGYVPQDVAMIDGTLRQNVSMGFPDSDATDERVLFALKIALLEEFVKSLPDGLETNIGTRGTKLSGGQRQRLGIARAFFTKPKLLFLDESTSALDAQTENEMIQALEGVKYDITMVIVAHRLSTIQSSKQLLYMDSGRILARGDFEEVRKRVPDFAIQANLMGL